MGKIATYGMLCLIGCALTDIANATSLAECQAIEMNNAKTEDQLKCYKSLAVELQAQTSQRKSSIQQNSESQHDNGATSGVNSTVAKDCTATKASCEQDQQNKANPVLLEAHEPNRVGATWDSDDIRFMDFTLSMQYPIFYQSLAQSSWLPYVAFTGRFGQYIGTRPSSPVIAKRYNPKIFVRHFLNGRKVQEKDQLEADYYDIEYAHISNGQSIDSLQSFNVHAADLGNAEYTKDYISRGWDYFGITGKTHPDYAKGLTVRYGFKHYFGGLMQNKVEQYFPWEAAREITKLSQVSGLHLAGKYDISDYYNIAVSFDTGTNHPFKHNTLEAEFGIAPFHNIFGIPIVFTYRNGYNSDLAQYYKKVTSLGFALKLESFKDFK